MGDIIRRESEGKIIQAAIRVARVQIEALCSDDVVPKLDLSYGQGEPNPITRVNWDEEGELPRLWFDVDVPVLGFNEELLYVDGYMAGRLLQNIQEQKGELWFIFGAFRSQNGKRYYIVLPRDQVPKCLAVLNWEILSWTEKEIHRF